MDQEHAVRQLEYVVAPRLGSDAFGHWDRSVYGDIVSDVAANGTSADVHDLIEHVGDRVEDGHRPAPAAVREYADGLLETGGRPLTDGGDA